MGQYIDKYDLKRIEQLRENKNYDAALEAINELDSKRFFDEYQRLEFLDLKITCLTAKILSSDLEEIRNSTYDIEAYNLLDELDEIHGTNDRYNIFASLICDHVRKPWSARLYAILVMDSNEQYYRDTAYRLYEKNTAFIFDECFDAYKTKPWTKGEYADDKEFCDFLEAEAEGNKFTNYIKYEQRKFLFLARNTKQLAGTFKLYNNNPLQCFFTLDKLPPDIIFPYGRPSEGLYMAHPVKTNEYLPFKNVEETLFMEKVNEFCWLAQCLGATEIIFHSNKGLSVSEGFGNSLNVDGNIGFKIANIGGSYGTSNNYNQSRSYSGKVEMRQVFSPMTTPHCPNDLKWYDSEPRWKQLVKQRLHGGLLEDCIKISTSSNVNISQNEVDNLKVSFEYAMLKANASYNAQNDTTFSKREETEWSIQVTFKPLNEFGKQSTTNTDSLSPKEEDYIEEFKACLADVNGTISNSQRRLLEKIRVSLRISESRAKELEAMCSVPQLTDEEKEYLAEYKACLNDGGTITASERRLLERVRKSLGISEQRAKELELN